ncbi:U32 family peptidase [Homoserinibacter sp. GY 40078]|uniref:U32 family peptidase n=1 Tax=Homoserinibacter sp. GY 40078 TaxID=2603275 RepID=UPI0011CB8E3D|nr:U32 family peptidase [Homoserinibacter sp. GY 40078]TXK19292.1 peptidase [Homoserinibacter sp. GY 40078]
MTIDTAREHLASLGYAPGDIADAPTSTLRFADGGWFKWEVAGALDAPSLATLHATLAAEGVRLHQATNTVGTMRYLDAEITDLVQTARDLGVQLRMASGPRGTYDIGGQKLASGNVAAASAYRLRGGDHLAQGLDDVLHAIELGVRGFLVFDEGLLHVLHQLRTRGAIPDIRVKASSNMGAANPAHTALLAATGADSVNLQRDLDVSMIAAIRASTPVPLDLHTDNPRATGGFVRGYDVPEFVRVGAPVYLKAGNAAQDFSDDAPTPRVIDGIVRQILLDRQQIDRHLPEAVASDNPEF